MSAFTTNTSSMSLFGSVSAMVHNMSETFALYRQYKRTVDELNSLSAMELNDLGLSKSTIKSVAMEAVYGV